MVPGYFRSLLLVIPLVLISAGCVARKDRSGLLKGIPTTQVRLEPQHTDAPDLMITLPQGFQAEWVKEARYDKFYIYNLADTGATQRALLIVDLSPTPILSIDDTAKVEKSRGDVAGNKVIWTESVFHDDTVNVYQRETIQRDILKIYQGTDHSGPLVLHAIVAGRDRDLVEKLTASVETIQVLPGKPNL